MGKGEEKTPVLSSKDKVESLRGERLAEAACTSREGRTGSADGYAAQHKRVHRMTEKFAVFFFSLRRKLFKQIVEVALFLDAPLSEAHAYSSALTRYQSRSTFRKAPSYLGNTRTCALRWGRHIHIFDLLKYIRN